MLGAQHGMAGCTAQGCELLLEAVESAVTAKHLQDAFLDEVEAVFVIDEVLAS